MTSGDGSPELNPQDSDLGLRERKRRDTARRITDAGLRLFAGQGYEATTLDEIAAAAGISRRTFFHYFKSKDEILLSLQAGYGEQLAAALRDSPPGLRPLEAMRDAMLRMVTAFAPDDLLALDRLMRSSEAVQSRKQASYIRDEAVLFDSLRQRWPDEPEAALRLVAMLSIGISRQSLDQWSRTSAARPLEDHITEAFAALRTLG